MTRLRRADPERPGITRRRRGRGFSYTDASGALVDHEVRSAIESLAIPPAWTQVWISPYRNDHIQAVGTDDAGRRQYLYHPAWHEQQNATKHDRVLILAGRLPTVRARITRDLRRRGLGRDRVLAGVLRVLDTGAFRPGSEHYAETYGSHGVTTLTRSDVSVAGDEVRFVFTAKGGLEQDVRLRDKDLRALVVVLRRARPDLDRLFVHHDGSGWHPVHAELVNERFKELAGEEFTVKDLRTWQATVRAAVFLAQEAEPTSASARRQVLAEVMRRVADDLGNTAAVARASYVDPRVLEAGEAGRTVQRALERLNSDDLANPRTRAAIERSVIRLLTTS